MLNSKTVIKTLSLFGFAGLTIYSLNTLTKDSSAQAEGAFSTAVVKGTVVEVGKLPQISPGNRTTHGQAVTPTRIPIGEAQLAKIKADPLSTAAGKAATKSALKVTTVDAPPPIKGKATSTYNCVGNGATGFAPSDSHGAVGGSHYVEVTNVDLGIYSKTGCAAALSFVSLKSFFGVTDATVTLFDPRAIYDFANRRYVVTAESRKTGSTDQTQYFAVSKTGNPLGAWTRYNIALSSGASFFCKKAVTDFWDYPNLGYNKDKWFVTANNFPSAGGAYGAIMTIDKAPTLTGGATTLRCYGTGASAVQFNVAPPLNRSKTSTVAYFLSPGSGSGTQLQKYTLDTVTNVMTFGPGIPIPAWTAPPGAAQPTTALVIDTLDGRIQSNTVQIGNSVYAIHSLNVGGRAALRLYKVNAGTNTAAVQTTYAITNADSWGPSFAIASNSATTYGFYAFNYSSATLNPAAALVSRRNDGVGGNNLGFTYAVGVPMTSNCQNGTRCRWGDYSATSLNPSNLSSAFGVAQYLTGGSQFNWTTRIMGLSQP